MKKEPLNVLPDENPNVYKFDREDDKPLYAAYLNTAKQNVFLILRDISDKLELSFELNDIKIYSAELWSILRKNDPTETALKIIDRLNHQFSFLEPLALNHARDKIYSNEATASPADYCEVLQLWIGQLNSYRNYYTHATHSPVEMNASIVDGMRILFDTEFREFKVRFAFSTLDAEHLERRGKGGKEKRNFRYAFMDREGVTEKGFLYFVCLWLEKKDAQELLKKHKGFKRSEYTYEKATLERYTWFRTRIPKPRLVSDHSDEGLFMDMVNELKRCPRQLHRLLSESDRDKFKPEDFNDEPYPDEGYELIPALTRHSNRFYYFALRFLDGSFKYLKYHVDLGNYCFNSYDQVIEEIPRKRRWVKRMTGFGNLTDFDESSRPAIWGEKFPETSALAKPETYITETTPHYHFDGEGDVKNIGLKWIDTYDKSKIWPDVTSTDGNDSRPKTDAPDYWLSLYELPALVFYQMLHLQDNTRVKVSAEEVINDYQLRIGQFLSEVANGQIIAGYTTETLTTELDKRNLHISYVPKAVVKYLLRKESQSHDEKAVIRLQGLIEENKRLQSKVKRQESHHLSHTSSKDYVAMKSGHMADFMARDMIRLQKPVDQDQGKANSSEFQVLQAKLAFFGKSKTTLRETFRLCNLIDADNAHPFLHQMEVEKYHGILDFYTEYLHLRGSYFQLCLLEKQYSQYHFLKLREVDISIKTLIQRQQAAVTNLPRGLFKKPILDALLSSNETRELGRRLKEEPRVNVSYIIQSYFEQVRHDASQEFYDYKRNYELLDKLYDTRKPRDRSKTKKRYFDGQELKQNAEEIKQKLEEKIAKHIKVNRVHDVLNQQRVKDNYYKSYKRFTESEKQIRLYKNCDMVLFMMTDQLFRHGDFLHDPTKKNEKRALLELSDSYQLCTIKPNAEKSMLAMQMSVALPIRYPDKTKTHVKMIAREKLKVKNYGDFRGFLKDRRVYNLLPYIADDVIQFEALQQEFRVYHESRIRVFKAIISFERATIAKYNCTPEGEENYIDHPVLLDQRAELTEEQKVMMIALRNAYCHSEYPDAEKFQQLIDGTGFNALKDYGKDNQGVLEKSIILQLEKIAIRLYQDATAEGY